MGCALAVAGNPMLDVIEKAKAPSAGLVLALLGGALGLLVCFVIRNEPFRESIRYTIQGISLYPIFYGAIRFPGWGPFKLFNLSVMRFLGKLSYSLYLVHQVIIYLLEAHLKLPPVPRQTCALLLSVALSWLIWTTIEQPLARVRKRLEVRALAPSTATAAE
jgi:peptidoglycan/LPS O-acetylase OafA/YrhL